MSYLIIDNEFDLPKISEELTQRVLRWAYLKEILIVTEDFSIIEVDVLRNHIGATYFVKDTVKIKEKYKWN